jgi:hypothetical protein
MEIEIVIGTAYILWAAIKEGTLVSRKGMSQIRSGNLSQGQEKVGKGSALVVVRDAREVTRL